MYRILKLNESAKLNENSIEEYWDAKVIDGKAFMKLLKFNFGADSKGNNYIVTNDANEVTRFRANSDEEATKKFRTEFLKEEETLTEAPEDEEELLQDIEDTEEEIEDTLNSEEDQEENPVEEDESTLDTQLDELRDILVDLDLNLYQVASKENPNNVIYIVGKVAENSNDVLMLIDTKPEELNEPEEENPIIDDVETDEVIEDSEVPEEKPEEEETENEERYDFIKIPASFDEINKLSPRYGEEITPDHESLVEYLMNCLIEVNPEAAEELQSEETPEEVTDLPGDTEDINLDIDIDGEEDKDNE